MDIDLISLSIKNINKLSKYLINSIQILLVIRGEILLDFNKKQMLMKKDDIILINEHDIYAVSGDSENMVLTLTVPKDYIKKNCSELLGRKLICNSTEHVTRNQFEYFELKRLLTQMMMVYYKQDNGFKIELSYQLLHIMHNLFLNFSVDTSDKTEFKATSTDARIQEVLEYMHTNFHQPITLEELAQKTYISAFYLSKLFKTKMGCGFWQYLNEIRLVHAVEHLLSSDDSLTKISLENGFSNVKTFTSLFKKKYGQTPKVYKQKKSDEKTKISTNGDVYSEFSPIGSEDGLNALMRYMRAYDIRYSRKNYTKQKFDVSLKNSENDKLSLPEIIFRIGVLSDVLQKETQQQLMLAQKSIKGKYVYFRSSIFDNPRNFASHDIYKDFEFNQAMEFLDTIGLIPFISVPISKSSDVPSDTYVQDVCGKLTVFLKMTEQNYNCMHMNEWMFVVEPEDVDNDTFLNCYCEIYKILKSYSPKIKVGLFSLEGKSNAQQRVFCERLRAIKAQFCPDFLTLTADSGYENTSVGQSELDFEMFKGYNESVVHTVRQLVDKEGMSISDIYITKWNTLSGRTSLEASAFSRLALIVDDMLSLSGKVKGVTCWLDGYSALINKCNIHFLSLFFYKSIKRPPFYILDAIFRHGNIVIAKDKTLIITRTDKGNYVIMMYNPSYFNPIYAVQSLIGYDKQFEVTISDIDKGHYRIKMLTYDLGNDNIYLKNIQTGYQNLFDGDVENYLKHAHMPDFAIFTEKITDRYTFYGSLMYNAVIMYIIEKISSDQ